MRGERPPRNVIDSDVYRGVFADLWSTDADVTPGVRYMANCASDMTLERSPPRADGGDP